MKTQKIRKFKWFWLWQDQKEEAWLDYMSGSGMHLTSVMPFGFYQFEVGEPQKWTYRLEFLTSHKDRSESERDHWLSDWELVSELSAWRYFRKRLTPGNAIDLTRQKHQKIETFRRLLGFLVVFSPMWIFLFSGSKAIFHGIPQFFVFSLMGFYSITIVKIIQRIHELGASE